MLSLRICTHTYRMAKRESFCWFWLAATNAHSMHLLTHCTDIANFELSIVSLSPSLSRICFYLWFRLSPKLFYTHETNLCRHICTKWNRTFLDVVSLAGNLVKGQIVHWISIQLWKRNSQVPNVQGKLDEHRANICVPNFVVSVFFFMNSKFNHKNWPTRKFRTKNESFRKWFDGFVEIHLKVTIRFRRQRNQVDFSSGRFKKKELQLSSYMTWNSKANSFTHKFNKHFRLN